MSLMHDRAVRARIFPAVVFEAQEDLIPVVVQDLSGMVLMLAYANAEAYRLTRETGLAHFWSRSRRRIWRKGERSGYELRVRRVLLDCDGDALLYRVERAGPACHTGEVSCFRPARA